MWYAHLNQQWFNQFALGAKLTLNSGAQQVTNNNDSFVLMLNWWRWHHPREPWVGTMPRSPAPTISLTCPSALTSTRKGYQAVLVLLLPVPSAGMLQSLTGPPSIFSPQSTSLGLDLPLCTAVLQWVGSSAHTTWECTIKINAPNYLHIFMLPFFILCL